MTAVHVQRLKEFVLKFLNIKPLLGQTSPPTINQIMKAIKFLVVNTCILCRTHPHYQTMVTSIWFDKHTYK